MQPEVKRRSSVPMRQFVCQDFDQTGQHRNILTTQKLLTYLSEVLAFTVSTLLVGHQEEHPACNQKAPQGGCGHRRQHARLRYLSEVQKPRDLDLDLGSGQGHVSIHSTCRTTCRPNHVTVALRSTEIWPFECRQISILDEV